ncbi:MAG: DUF87 domain-containing protein [Anaerolineae bacterium]|nr:DUF87 domain-containing protein [Anaerolineae bacterium]
MGRYDDDYQDDELDDEPDDLDEDDDGGSGSGVNPFGSGKPRTAPPGTGGLGPRPSGLVSGGPGAPGGFSSSRPNLPGSPPSTLGGNRPNLPGSPPSTLGGSRPNLPGSPPSTLGGNRPNLPGSPPSTFGGNRPNLPGSPPGTLGGRPPSQPLPGVRGNEPAKGEGKSGGLFGGLGGKKGDAPKSRDGGKGLGGRLPFGGNKDTKKAPAPRGDKSARGNPLGGFASKLPFGSKSGEQKKEPKSGSGLGGRMPFGGGRPDSSKTDSRPLGSYGGGAPTSSPLGASRSTFGGPGDGPGGASSRGARASGQRRFEMPFGLGGLFGGKKDAKAAKQRASRAPKVDQGGLSLDTKLDILGVALVVVALALLLASLSPNQGAITGQVNELLAYHFGWGAFAVPLVMLAWGIWLLIRHFGDDAPTLQVQRVIGLAVLFITVLTLMQFVESWSYNIQDPNYLTALREVYLPWSYEQGRGGGLIGGEIYYFLLSNFTEWGGFALLFIPLIVGIMLSLSISAAELAMILVSNVRNMRDRAHQRSIRVAAERAQRDEQQRALTAQSQAQIGVTKPETQSLPGGAQAALPSPAESPVPMPLPLGEQRSISITQGGRTINTSFNPDDLTEEEPMFPAARAAPAASTLSAQAEKPSSGGRSGLGLGKLVPAGLAGGAAAAMRALTPTEEKGARSPEKTDGAKKGLGARLPFGGRKNNDTDSSKPPQPVAATPGLRSQAVAEPTRDGSASGAKPVEPAPAPPLTPANVPPPSVQQPAASLGARPASPAASDSEERPPRFGEVLRPQTAGSKPLAGTEKPGQPVSPGLRPQPFQPAQSAPAPFEKPAATSETPKSEEDEWAKLPPAQPKGISGSPQTSQSPFAPRVMQPRTESNPVSAKPDAASDEDQPASSSPTSWQDRMAALRGTLPGSGKDAEQKSPETAASADRAIDNGLNGPKSALHPRPFEPTKFTEEERKPPRIVPLDEDDELDEDDLKPATAKPAAPQSSSPFAPRTPIRESSVFGKPENTPPVISRPPSPTPSAPAAGTTAPPPRTPAAPAAPAATVASSEPPAPPTRKRTEWREPDPGTLLATGMDQELDHALLLQRAKTIEETLDAFGAPGRVVEVRTGPVITQFGVEPDYLTVRGGKKVRVKVGTIAQLDKDLQLALGAKSIRIEAPVPGKGYVGIEVPNEQASIVRLRDVMESDQFKRIKSSLGIALGQGVDGTPVAADLSSMPHLLIAGTTGSGKSVCVNSIIASLLLENTPEQLKFIMVDPKRVELTAYNGIPHLVAPVVVELERIVGVLKWVTREMDERYRRFSAAGARNIDDFNKHLPSGEQLMPYIVVIIDELADLMMLAPEETERVITRLAALARATGIHLVIATQRPSVDVVTGLIKANFPTRIAFAVAGSVDSRVILDQPGAERLLGRGDMLYMSSDSPAPQRLQGVFVSDTEISNITRFWRQQMDDSDRAAAGRLNLSQFALDEMSKDSSRGSSGGGQVRQQAFWDRESGPASFVSSREPDDEDMGDGEDEMYDEAVKLVRTLKKASVSLLQRRLRIGYTRAARLIDLMEENGVVGPAQSGSTPREVIG